MRFHRQTIFLFICAFFASTSARAQSNPMSLESLDALGSQVRKQTDELSKKYSSRQVHVANPWTAETRQLYYGWKDPLPAVVNAIDGAIRYESPLAVQSVEAAIAVPFHKSDAEKIANQCKRSFPDWWDRIGCVSREVHAFFRNFRPGKIATPCLSHAYAFNAAFDALGIKRSLSRMTEANGDGDHVANAIIVTDDSGVTYSYVIDSGWFPGELFPQNLAAINFHDRDHDGRTDFFELPRIGSAP